MPLSTTQYGYIIDPLVPLTDDTGRTISNGYVRVFMAGTSTPVITYKNFDGATNEETVQLDNSGRTAYPVIGSKGSTYKVCVYDAEHSQETPILTVDKVVPNGASVNATNIVQGMNDVAGSGWIKSVSADDTANVSLDPTGVTSEVDTMVKATAASADYMMPLVHKTGSDPDKKITLGNIFKFVLNFIHSLTDTATESDIVSGNYFALDGSAGTKKLNSTTLLTKTAQNALAGNVAPLFDQNKPNDEGGYAYYYGTNVTYEGKNYVFVVNHASGPWDASEVEQKPISETFDLQGVGQAVQEWLDEHPEATTTVEDYSLTLRKLTNETLNSISLQFNSVSNMANATQLKNGMYVRTLGYYSPDLGGGAIYKITEKNVSDIEDGFLKIFLEGNLVANLLSIDTDGKIDLRWTGAKPDNSEDCSSYFLKAIEYSNNHALIPIEIIGNFKLSQQITFNGGINLIGKSNEFRKLFNTTNLPNLSVYKNSCITLDGTFTAFKITGAGTSGTSNARFSFIFIDGVEIAGSGKTATFIDVDAFGAPSRPSFVKNCKIHGLNTFFKSIRNTSLSTLGTLIYTMDIFDNNVFDCNLFLDIECPSGGGSIGGLNIHDNVIEQGGLFNLKNLYGSNFIVNNLIEGTTGNGIITLQRDASLTFDGNYLEANNGQLNIEGSYNREFTISSGATLKLTNVWSQYNNNFSIYLKNLTITEIPLRKSGSISLTFENIAFKGNSGLVALGYKLSSFVENRIYIFDSLPVVYDEKVLTGSSDIKSVYRGMNVYTSKNAMAFGNNGVATSIEFSEGDYFIASWYSRYFGSYEQIQFIGNDSQANYGISFTVQQPTTGYFVFIGKTIRSHSGNGRVNMNNGGQPGVIDISTSDIVLKTTATNELLADCVAVTSNNPPAIVYKN